MRQSESVEPAGGDSTDYERRWYARPYRSFGTFVHVVGPDGLVFCIDLLGAKTLARKLTEAVEAAQPDSAGREMIE